MTVRWAVILIQTFCSGVALHRRRQPGTHCPAQGKESGWRSLFLQPVSSTIWFTTGIKKWFDDAKQQQLMGAECSSCTWNMQLIWLWFPCRSKLWVWKISSVRVDTINHFKLFAGKLWPPRPQRHQDHGLFPTQPGLQIHALAGIRRQHVPGCWSTPCLCWMLLTYTVVCSFIDKDFFSEANLFSYIQHHLGDF